MAFVIVNITNETALKNLQNWLTGERRTYVSEKKWLIRALGRETYLLEANGAVLALLLELRKKYNGDVYIYAVEPLHEDEFPKEVKEVVEKCLEEKRYLLKKDLEKLSKIKLECSVSLKESSSD